MVAQVRPPTLPSGRCPQAPLPPFAPLPAPRPHPRRPLARAGCRPTPIPPPHPHTLASAAPTHSHRQVPPGFEPKLNPAEVDAAFHVPLSTFLSDRNHVCWDVRGSKGSRWGPAGCAAAAMLSPGACAAPGAARPRCLQAALRLRAARRGAA